MKSDFDLGQNYPNRIGASSVIPYQLRRIDA